MAVPVPPVVELLSAALPDSIRIKMLGALVRGDIRGAISLWQLHTNRDKAPAALQAMQDAYSVANRAMGPCMQVAKDIFSGFKAFGGSPQYIRFVPPGKVPYLGWEMRGGDPRSTIQVSDLGKHYAVMVNGRIYDAFTGSEGMLLNEYLRRLVTPDGVPLWEVVSRL